MADAHVDEGALIRFLDRAADVEERRHVDEHVAGCAACARSLEELRAIGERLAMELPLAPADVPPLRLRRRGRGTLRRWAIAAGVVGVAALLAAGAPPLWALARAALRALREPPPQQLPAPAPINGTSAAERTIVELFPQGPNVVIDFSSRPTAGTLTVEAYDGSTIVLRTTHRRVAGVTVLPSRIRVDNANLDSADYRLLVPRDRQEVKVSLAGSAILATDGNGLVTSGPQRIRLR